MDYFCRAFDGLGIFKILAFSLPLQMIQSTSGAIYQAAGKTDHMFYNGIVNTIITVSGFLIAAFWGRSLESMAWAWVITLIINFIDSYWILYHFTIKESVLPFYNSLLPQLLNTFCTFLLVFLLTLYIPESNVFFSLFWKTISIVTLTTIWARVLGQYDIIKSIKLILVDKRQQIEESR